MFKKKKQKSSTYTLTTMKKTVLITGATSGIGKACAELFAKNNYRLILTGRRKERLEELAKNLIGTEVFLLNFDIRQRKQTFDAIDSLPQEWKQIDLLINNAGLAAGIASFDSAELDDWEQMIDTNLKGLLYITKAVLPLMPDNNGSHIINLASIAGKEVYPNGNVYCATKFAVDALSKAMRIDLLSRAIKVTNIAPGMVETEFSIVRFKGDAEKAKNAYKGLQPLVAEDVADVIFFAASRPAHVNINDIVLTPVAQGSATLAIRK
jgi:NADP-dependent 3-hydroxy acid dehydrogenase YdfG